MTVLTEPGAAGELKPSARHLISDEGFGAAVRVVRRANVDVDEAMAGRIVDEALKFVAAAAANRTPGLALRPARIVDEGWHALIQDTRTYKQLADELGAFVHYVPETPATKRHDDVAVMRTLNAVQRAGFAPDLYLWCKEAQGAVLVSADCMHSECTEGGSGCSAPEGG
ncbi:hypothetical protein [Streptomyces melanogenes]|uniref:hypothetical protein n=1 Tax=Streptomyces melanogenes TaxID=67326 RepID=UPI00167D277D|nr:hypothetical protein [Streptomyces melanogenes]GGP37902.1 hypothetical protein GCM10010278_13600 [Streptomyces melanogenes]